MDASRLRQLAGLNSELSESEHQLLRTLNEVVQLPPDLTLDDAIKRLDACRRALSIVNKIKDPVDRKKWLSATFVNLNKVSHAVERILNKTGLPPEGHPLSRKPLPRVDD